MQKKRLVGFIGICFTASRLFAQTPVTPPAQYTTGITVNYVRIWEPVKPYSAVAEVIDSNRTTKEVRQTTQYVDGLGRMIQSVRKKGSMATGASQYDLVMPVVYDGFGREQFKYLPYASSSATNGNFKTNPFNEQVSFYNNQLTGQTGETNIGPGSLNWAYSQQKFEASPLNRIEESFAPGVSWVGTNAQSNPDNRKSVKQKYLINTSLDSVRVWEVTEVSNAFGTYASSSVYSAGQLYKTITEDEHNKQAIEFKDKEGKVILKKVQLNAGRDDGVGKGHDGWICTYYIYDDLNNLRAVIQPEGVKNMAPNSWTLTTTLLNEQCFRYEYDHRNRMVRKKVPGAEEVWVVYDARDRLVMTQDGNMRSTSQKKWMYTLYDSQNRPIVTGLMTDASNYNNLSYHQSRADTSIAYPNIGSYTTDELTRTFYDDYSWRSSWSNPLTDTFKTTWNIHLQSASTSDWPYAETPAKSELTRGMVTGTRIKVLGTSTYLFSVMIYDAKGRQIQVQAQNLSTGTDVSTTQYGWQGLPITIVQKTEKAGANSQTSVSVSLKTYDDLGRLVKTEKKVSNTKVASDAMPGSWTVVAENGYDKLGQLVKKKLGRTKNTNGTYGSTPIDSLLYDYNIRGWMLGANRSYVKDTTSTASYFGFDLGYDKDTFTVNSNTKTYTAKQYNGNITGMLWRSTGDDMLRKYDFTYDAFNRLTDAGFMQLNANTFNLSAGIDFSVHGMSYDFNGNIISMNQKGWKPGGSETIDSLLYTYSSYSNKLKNVIDRKNDTLTKLGDFRSSTAYMASLSHNKTTGATDYDYDINGNLLYDKNKDIANIYYNHLNLPDSVVVTGKGHIKYIYDAGGNKIKKITRETGKPDKTTLYMGGVVYENDTLQFVGQEEGRIRFDTDSNHLHYDYFVKDHLGNVRMVLTEQRRTDAYDPASLETASLADERVIYYRVDSARVDRTTISGYPTNDTYTNPNTFIQQLNGNGIKVGVGTVLKVMAGDKFNVRASSWWKSTNTPGTPVNPADELLAALITGFGGVPGTKGSSSQLGTSGILNPGTASFLTNQTGTYTTSKPKAFVNWIVFDEQFQYVAASSGFEQVGDSEDFSLHELSDLTISKNGYLYVYVSNETPNIDVFFDNLQVTHIRGPILEETHYYPFGLTMAGISTKAANNFSNKQKFSSQELNSDMDIGWYEFAFRFMDPQIGRFLKIDPLASKYVYNSTYAYAENKVTIGIDFEGLELLPVNSSWFRIVSESRNLTNYNQKEWRERVVLMGRNVPDAYKDASGNPLFSPNSVGVVASGQRPAKNARNIKDPHRLPVAKWPWQQNKISPTESTVGGYMGTSVSDNKAYADGWRGRIGGAQEVQKWTYLYSEAIPIWEASIDLGKQTKTFYEATAIADKALNGFLLFIGLGDVHVNNARADLVNFLLDGTLPYSILDKANEGYQLKLMEYGIELLNKNYQNGVEKETQELYLILKALAKDPIDRLKKKGSLN
jgi:RHS repeat-associated protein